MKKYLFILITITMALCLSAQTKIKMYVWHNNEATHKINIQNIDSITFIEEEIVAQQGALKGVFSVSATKKVNFSQGNLQFNAMEGTHQRADGTNASGTWRFAEHQYDKIGYNNIKIGMNYDGWIDLFGWGTSGWYSGASAYLPYSASTSDAAYYVGGGYTNDLIGPYAYADWGVYNPISNGGNQPGQWRTLTYNEWYYLFDARTNATKLRAKATVCGVAGYVLLPDNWELPEGLTFKLTPSTWEWNTNIYSSDKWELMENAGAVFLPCAGVRHGTDQVDGNGSSGIYWSATSYDASNARRIGFYYDYMGASYYSLRHLGQSVRLVNDIIEE